MSIMSGTRHIFTVLCISMAFLMAIGSIAVAACERPLDLPNPNPYGYDFEIYVFMFVFSFYTFFCHCCRLQVPKPTRTSFWRMVPSHAEMISSVNVWAMECVGDTPTFRPVVWFKYEYVFCFMYVRIRGTGFSLRILRVQFIVHFHLTCMWSDWVACFHKLRYLIYWLARCHWWHHEHFMFVKIDNIALCPISQFHIFL
jgi:hypothetical protein